MADPDLPDSEARALTPTLPEAGDPSTSDTAPAVSATRAVTTTPSGEGGSSSWSDTLTEEAQGRYAPPPGEDDPTEIGRGGIGRVFVALDRHLGREIAVKELLRSMTVSTDAGDTPADLPPAAARFLREARVTGQLEHPNIVPVYELGVRPGGTLYYTMKLVRGRTLAAALRDCRGLDDRLGLLSHFVDLCHAIAYAHSRDVIHRDIKTDNVMLGEFGETLVLDWGLAKVRGKKDIRAGDLQRDIQVLREASADLTAAGHAIGTPAYMSPEQALGELDQIDERSDIWSLGAVLYELLVGRPPFVGQSALEVLTQVAGDRVRPPRARLPEVPPELDSVCRRALERDKSKRYDSALALAREIQAWQSGARVRAHEYTSWELLRRFVARNKTLSAAAALLLVVLATATVLIFGAYQDAEAARGQEEEARLATEDALAREQLTRERETRQRRRAQREQRQAHFNLALAFQEKADRLLDEGRIAGARILSAAALEHNPHNPFSPHRYPAGEEPDEPAGAHAIATAQTGLFRAKMEGIFRHAETLTGAGDDPWRVAFSPDGSTLAVSSGEPLIRLRDLSGGDWLPPLDIGCRMVTRVLFSPHGRRLYAICRKGRVRAWATKNWQVRFTLEAHDAAEPGALALSRDGARLATGGLDGLVRTWRAEDGEPQGTFDTRKQAVQALDYSPDGSLLAVAVTEGDGRSPIQLRRAGDGELLATLEGHLGPLWALAFSPDGRLLASGGFDKLLRLWNVAERKLDRAFEHHTSDVTAAVFSSDGGWLATAGVDRSVALWNVPERKVRAALAAHNGPIFGIAFSPDARRLATASFDDTVRLWDLDRSSPAFVRRTDKALLRAELVGDQRLLTHELGGRVRLWDLGGDGPTTTLVEARQGPDSGPEGGSISSDGRVYVFRGEPGEVRVLDVPSRRPLPTIPTGPVRRMGLSPDGTRLVVAAPDGAGSMWNVRTAARTHRLEGLPAVTQAVSFSRDGKRFAVAGARAVQLWRTDPPQRETVIEEPGEGVHDAQFSPSGELLITYGGKPTIRVYQLASKTLVRELHGHEAEVVRAIWSSDGRFILSSGRDATVRLWSAESWRPLQRLPVEMLSFGLAFSPDTKRFAIAEVTGVLRVYPLEVDLWRGDPRALLEAAERQAGLKLDGFSLVPTAPAASPSE